ncbi:MAG: hypothetical protein HN348_16550, partial [Proteobacteria bacterium]|nr:hypothetical protein [Pseudomonadota bacterium]
ISLDGGPEYMRKYRRSPKGTVDPYDHLMALLPELMATPRVVVSQTIAPSGANEAASNFEHLRSLGFWRFNLLPGYFLPWRRQQLVALRQSFAAIREHIVEAWRNKQRFYLRNLFTWAPTPFVNTGLVVDADRSIHPSNASLCGLLADLHRHTRLGSLDNPPSEDSLRQASALMPDLLRRHLSEEIWSSTLAADAELSRLCRSLYGEYGEFRAWRKSSKEGDLD